ncbi:MAG: ADP-heptose:LPS heptosyltransferase [Candidatus Marinamargulisbacteria bacterium]|jgi:ADP-heptose:LPS heptosyltransferase
MAIKIPESPKILVARGDVFGDTVLATVVIAPLKRAYPGCEITFMVQPMFAELLRSDPNIADVIEDPFDYDEDGRVSEKVRSLARQIRERNFDLYLGLWEQPRYAWVGFLSRIPIRVGHGFSLENTTLYTHTARFDRRDFSQHQADLNLSICQRLGIAVDESPLSIVADPQKVLALKERLSLANAPFCLMDVATKNPQKLMVIHHMAEVMDYILRVKKMPIAILTTDPDSQDKARRLSKFLKHHPLLTILDKVSLSDLAGLMSAATFFVGPDSGPMHLAAGVQCPSLVYYLNRIQSPLNWGPWKSPHIAVHANHSCRDVCESSVCRKLDCRVGLPMDALRQGIDQLISGETPNRNDQRAYWTKASSHVAVSSRFPDLFSELERAGWRCFVYEPTWSLTQIRTFLADYNICYIASGKTGISGKFERLKLRVARTWASNYMAYFGKVIKAASCADFESKVLP